jgi:hypothetical protein
MPDAHMLTDTTTPAPPAPPERSGPSGDPMSDHAIDRQVAREALSQAVAEAATWRAVARRASRRAAALMRLTRRGTTRRYEQSPDAASPELVRLLVHLRSMIACHVGALRSAGAPVERVLVEVKSLVREAVALEAWYDPSDALMGQVVHWTISAYYDEPADEPSL